MGSEALELALAVYRTPIKRHALYDMALPQDIGLVLQLASAPQPLLSEVAAEADESEDTVVEAARFYLQLALFQPDADAYRVLGLADDAPHQRIREHYRWLQRWLHPDRRGEDWEALFATRVNWAWSNLRNEGARRAYDSENDHGESTLSDHDAAVEVRRSTAWNPLHAHASRTSRASKVVIGALLCACVALLYLALTRSDNAPPDEIGARPTQAASKGSGAVTPTDLSSSSVSSASVPREQSSPMSEASIPDWKSHDASALRDGGEEGKEELAQPADSHEIDVALASALRAAAAEGNALAPKSSSPAIADASDAQSTPREGVSAQESGKSSTAIRKPKSADNESKAPADAAGKTTLDHDRRVASVESSAAGQVASTAGAADKGPITRSPPGSATIPAAVEHSPAAPGEPGKVHAAAHGGERNGVGSTDDALARIDLAHQRVKELSAFFSKFDSRLPPIWNDLAGQAGAEAQRSALFERAGQHDPGDFVVDDPRWRMSQDSAALSANYHLLKRNSVSESGRLLLSMVWRERMWLVTQVELRPTL
jgi:hypothetical protein